MYCDSEVDCGDCASPSAWCQEMREIRDDSVCQYVSYVGCYQTVLTELYRRAVMITQSGRCHLNRFVLSLMI